MPKKQFLNRLHRLREEHGLSLEQVSQATGLSFATLYAAETDAREILLRTALRLAQFYGLPLENVWEPLYQRICDEVVPAPKPCA